MSLLKTVKEMFGRMFSQNDVQMTEDEEAKIAHRKLRNQLRREQSIRLGKHRRTRR
jgi:hypothetical protein